MTFANWDGGPSPPISYVIKRKSAPADGLDDVTICLPHSRGYDRVFPASLNAER
jgi:hypothetical protein